MLAGSVMPMSRNFPLTAHERGRKSIVGAMIVLLVCLNSAPGGSQALPPSRSGLPEQRQSDSLQLADFRRQLAELRGEINRLTSVRDADRTAPSSVVVAAGKDGFSVETADRVFLARLRAYFQTDGRARLGSSSAQLTSTFLLRRMRPILEITMWRFMDFRLMHDFADGRLYDANFDLRLDKRFSVRAGKFKPPVGLERLQSAADLIFVERGMPTNLAPSRDVGVQAFGDLLGGTFNYAAGFFNGVPDLANGDVDNGATKDAAGRVLVTPFNKTSIAALRELTVGVAGSQGIQRGTVAAPFLPTYRSPSQQPVFAYRATGTEEGTVVAAGKHSRLYPQGTFYVGPFGAMAEYARSSQVVRRGASGTTLTHKAWQVVATYTLTGEKASYRGVVPAKVFDPAAGEWGAVELAARIGALTIDPRTFPLYADPLKQVRRQASWGTGVNWYLARSIRLLVDVDVTQFRGGAEGGNRSTERVFMTRL